VSEPKLYRILQVTFIAIIVLLVVPALIITAHGNRAFRRYWRGLSAMADGDYEAARRDIEWYVRERPHDRDALWELSCVRYFTNDYRGALEAYEAWLGGVEPPRGPYDRILNYMRAMDVGEQPVGICPRCIRPSRNLPQEFASAGLEMYAAREPGLGSYAEAARLFEACVERMPDRVGRADALWGAAIAWFHAGEFEACLGTLEAIEAEWGAEPSEAFESIRRYVHACSSGQAPEEDMPAVLAQYAPRSRIVP
jgi:hypothetical protein